jgi:hypothetical protein
MRRLLLVVAVMAVMAAMMVATAVPAFAEAKNFGQCHKSLNQGNFEPYSNLPKTNPELNAAIPPQIRSDFTNCPAPT